MTHSYLKQARGFRQFSQSSENSRFLRAQREALFLSIRRFSGEVWQVFVFVQSESRTWEKAWLCAPPIVIVIDSLRSC